MGEKATWKEKIKAARQLFDEYDVDWVEISNEKETVKVTRRQNGRSVAKDTKPVVINVINQNTIQMQVNVSIQKILEEVKQEYDPKKYRQAKEQLKQIEKELKKDNPDKGILKKGILWAAKFGEKIFWQLLPLIIQHYDKLAIL